VKKIFRGILFFIMAISIFFPNMETARAESSRIIWIGDSRFVGMKATAPVTDNDIFVCEGGRGLQWFKESGIHQVRDNLKSGDQIIFNLGVNDLGDIDQYIDYINSLVNSEWSGYEVSYMSINPINDSKANSNGYSVKNQQVIDFNTKIKNGIDSRIKYIDTYGQLISNIDSITEDGVHYTAETYTKIYQYAKNGSTDSSTSADNKCEDSDSSISADVPTKYEDIAWDSKYYQFDTTGINGSQNVCIAGNMQSDADSWGGSCGPGFPSSTGKINKMICQCYAACRAWDVLQHDGNSLVPWHWNWSVLHGNTPSGQGTISKDVSKPVEHSIVELYDGSNGHAAFIEKVNDDGSVVISECNVTTANEYGFQVGTYTSLQEWCNRYSWPFRVMWSPK
jgi:hypothetical protein